MIINNMNGDIINSKEIYLHDDYLIELKFLQNEKQLLLDFETFSQREKYQIVFKNVIGFEMTSFDFWGELFPIRTLDFHYVPFEKRKMLPALCKKRNEFNDIKKTNENDYIEVVFTFVTGDTLTVVCKEILYNK